MGLAVTIPPALQPWLGRALRFGHRARVSWRRLTRPITLGCRALVVDADGRILLVRHSYVEGWHIPGGGVGRAESAEAAARRELKEEVGLDARGPLRFHGLFFRPHHGNSDHVAVYVVQDWQGVPRCDGFEIIEARFYAAEALPAGTSPGTRRRIAEWQGRVKPDGTW